MYATEVSEIEIPFLHDAALVCEKRGYRLRSLYMDPSGVCIVSYWGCPPLSDIAQILQNYLPDDVSLDECERMVKEGDYYRWNESKENPNGYITIYTPDGLDYRTL